MGRGTEPPGFRITASKHFTAWLAQRHTAPQGGVQVIDPRSDDAPHWVRFSGQFEELYDVAVLRGAALPKALGFQTDEIRHQVWCENEDGPPTSWTANA